ncbi:hypothetical protein A8990_11183 [Paenibacillus taihuensis]|uniref:Uncharacterized protein n=1 Tax=Paenibacillus taihuensis TaxID=1156355 RepID=A0A3D9SCD9_9BACL|nr:CBO0543 family protein [Paenibacillus taihuensis]REE86186.1 hypothetical protein A8990_11183 [Paenibacillus taihuensis]
MILACNLAFLAVCIFTGTIKKWERFYKTMLYLSFCNLLYNLLCRDYKLWVYIPDFLMNHVNADLLNTFVLLPSVAMLFLGYLPASKRSTKVVYYLAWVAGFSTLEYIWYVYGSMVYDHGWNLVFSILFYFAMFYALELHHKSIKKALWFSLVVTTLIIIAFHVPVWL